MFMENSSTENDFAHIHDDFRVSVIGPNPSEVAFTDVAMRMSATKSSLSFSKSLEHLATKKQEHANDDNWYGQCAEIAALNREGNLAIFHSIPEFTNKLAWGYFNSYDHEGKIIGKLLVINLPLDYPRKQKEYDLLLPDLVESINLLHKENLLSEQERTKRLLNDDLTDKKYWLSSIPGETFEFELPTPTKVNIGEFQKAPDYDKDFFQQDFTPYCTSLLNSEHFDTLKEITRKISDTSPPIDQYQINGIIYSVDNHPLSVKGFESINLIPDDWESNAPEIRLGRITYAENNKLQENWVLDATGQKVFETGETVKIVNAFDEKGKKVREIRYLAIPTNDHEYKADSLHSITTPNNPYSSLVFGKIDSKGTIEWKAQFEFINNLPNATVISNWSRLVENYDDQLSAQESFMKYGQTLLGKKVEFQNSKEQLISAKVASKTKEQINSLKQRFKKQNSD
jgi:hypothetical protein